MPKIDENSDASCRCTAHREFTPVTNHSQSMSAHSRGLRFTPDMIRDQEMLVSSMSQQGISEDLIRRQFERLLEEQTKQLRFIKDEQVTDKTDSEKFAELKKCPKPELNAVLYNNAPSEGSSVASTYSQLANKADEACKDSHCQEIANELLQPAVCEERLGKTQPCAAETSSTPKIEPSSLLKIRLKKEALNSSKRNNGLQETATALKIIKDSKSKIAQARLDSEMEALVKLNGTQERRPDEQVQFNHITDGGVHYNKMESQGKIISANGLENSRNHDNPPFRRNHPHSLATFQNAIPSSKLSDYKFAESYQHPSTAAAQATATNAYTTPTPEQMHDSYKKQGTPYFELQEPKVIGGFTYFARKSQCIPKISGVTYDFSSEHLNHQNSSQSKQRTALSISH